MKLKFNQYPFKLACWITSITLLGLVLTLPAMANPLEILRITPSGKDVEAGRQVVFTFNQPVVPVGKMEREAYEIPINIKPALKCQWRWLNTSSLACQLGDETALQLATRYQLWITPGITTQAGQTMTKSFQHQFVTKLPAISYASFDKWEAPGMPKIRVYFNQAVTRESVAKHLSFILADKKNEKSVAVMVEAAAQEEEASQSTTLPENVSDTWLVFPQELLPLDTAVALTIEPGLQSHFGPETGIENKKVMNFHTFPAFKFLGVRCFNLEDEEIVIDAGTKKISNDQRCDPLQSVSLQFSSPVIKEAAKDHLLIMPDLAGGKTDYDPWENVYSYSSLDEPHESDKRYNLWLPQPLQAYQAYQVSGGIEFKDEFGRQLMEPIDMPFLTDHRAPSHAFEHELSVLESGVDSELPIVVTNLEKIHLSYRLLKADGWSTQQSHTITLPKVQDIAYYHPLGVRQLIGTDSGGIQGYFTTQPDINNEDAKRYNWFFNQVTPFYLQAKLGHHNTLVWVTDFATGQPVSNANISIYLDNYAPDQQPEPLATTLTDANGIALLPGTERLDPQLKNLYVYGDYQQEPRFFIQCQKEQAIALLPLDSDFQVRNISDNYEVYPYMRSKYGHIRTWGTTAQGIYKVGDTVQYKLLVRDQSNETFVAAPKDGYHLKVIDAMGKTVHEVKQLSLSAFGGYHGEFQIPKTAAVGWYQFELSAKFSDQADKMTWQPMRVLVSDFTPSAFRVRTVLNGELFHLGEQVTVDTTASLHAGGPYVDAQTRITALLKPQHLTPSHPQVKEFIFDVYNEEQADSETVYNTKAKIDDKGQLQTTFTLSEALKDVLYGQLIVESAVRDDRGKNIAHSAFATYVGRDRFVGLKETSWLLTAGETAKVLLTVVDAQGNMVTDTPITVNIQRLETKAARVKGAGNAYLTHYEHEWVPAGQCQEGATISAKAKQAEDIADAILTCHFIPEKSGSYKVIAKIKDSQERPHQTELGQWATGKDYVLWETSPGQGLELVAEQDTYKVGDTARYLVKNPYPGAQALITVERLGILKYWTTTLENSMEIIEVPVKEDYVPGFFVSVTIMSPRIDKPIKDQVDLGKPAFRMGYAKTQVKQPYKEIVVDIKTDKPVYKPREQVTIDLQAKPRHPQKNGETQPIELAVTVLDESVFDLLKGGKKYFDPYQGFYHLEELDLANFSLIMRLVGRQKFEKKGANAGGDGGATGLSMRSLFKFVSYWNPAIETDAEGKAQIQFTVPDNLTGWRVLVMAITPEDRMGLSDANFKVNRPIEVRPVLPNQVTAGDSFQAGFNVMNRTDKVRELTLELTATGPVIMLDKKENQSVATSMETFTAQPYKRYTHWLPLTTKAAGTIKLTALAYDSADKDALEQTLTVRPRRATTAAATYGTTVENSVTEAISFPTEIEPDVGGLTVVASPTVIGEVEGAFKYMRDYPYACWEQKLSKGTMASHYNSLTAYLTDLTWEDSKNLPQQTLNIATEYQAPNGGMAYYLAKADRVSPYLSAYTAMSFNWLRVAGYEVPSEVENKLHDYLLTFLRKNTMPNFYTKEMASSVRAVALAALAQAGKVTRGDINRYERHVQHMDLFGKAQYLAAALKVPGTGTIVEQTVDTILAHADQTSGRISFNESNSDRYKRILSSALRTECAILSSLTAYEQQRGEPGKEEGASKIGDIPFKLVRDITSRRKTRGHWENTQENMYCMNALIDYARYYEAESPVMTVRSWLDQEELGAASFNDVKDPPASFHHQMTPADPGHQGTVKLEKEGQGRVYYTIRMTYAETAASAKAINSGIEINREYQIQRDGQWQLLTSPMEIKTGDLVRVDLYLSSPAPRYFVVVDDPVPGGLEPVNRDLATTSQVDANQAEAAYANGSLWFNHREWREYDTYFWGFYHQELRHHAAIFYSDYLSAGNYHLSYVAQAIAPGEFNVMPTHAEEMYEPEIFGKGTPATLVVTRNADK
jgi:uncharacterized protein YfaS (alpha-2-macroglobulin family)